VEDKPHIEALGAASTPAPKRKQLKSVSKNSLLSPPGLPSLTPTTTPAKPKRVYPNTGFDEHPLPAKRRKVSEGDVFEDLYVPPPQGHALSYNQKQYQSVWLAVPPDAASASATNSMNTNRKAPRQRNATTVLAKATHSKPTATTSPKPKSVKTLKKSSSTTNKPSTTNEEDHYQALPSSTIQPVDKTLLCKQKVKSYPRDRLHFYNKVVQSKAHPAEVYYFVLNYNEALQQLILVPMAPKGILSGKRQGRPRFQCVLDTSTKNWEMAVSTNDYEPVPAFMVMKTPIVAQEAWDILGA
jgi:hypothetical protein